MQSLIRSKSAGVTGGRGTAGAGPGRDLLYLLLYLIWMHGHQGSLLYSRVFCDPLSGAVLRPSVRTITCPPSEVAQGSLPDKLIDAVLNDDFFGHVG